MGKSFFKTIAILMTAASVGLMLSGCVIEPVETEEIQSDTVLDINSIRPQDDYYGYVNASRFAGIDVMNYAGEADGFSSVPTEDILRQALLEIGTSDAEYEYGSKEYLIREYYNQRLAFYSNANPDDTMSSEERMIADYIEADLNSIMEISTLEQYLEVASDISRDYGIRLPISVKVSTDNLNAGCYALSVDNITGVCGVSLEKINEWCNFASHMHDDVVDYLQVAGYSSDEAERICRRIVETTVDLTRASDPDVYIMSRDYFNFENMQLVSNSQMDEILTNIDYDTLLSLYGIQDNPYDGCYVKDIPQLQFLNSLYTEENLDVLKGMLIYDFVSANARYIKKDYVSILGHPDGNGADPAYLAGADTLSDYFLANEVSMVFIDYYYTDEMEAELQRMITDIVGGYRNVISGSGWLSDEGKMLLLEKLNNIRFITGASVDTSVIDTEKADVIGDTFIDTLININRYNRECELNNLGREYDRMHPDVITLHDVNSYYKQDNTVTICAGIMGGDFFDTDRDYYMNLGGLGSVIAHEIGHAFDSNMISFDMNGNYNPSWIPEEDVQILLSHNQEAIEYFESVFPVFDVYYVDGARTLGENYADLSGMEVLTSLCSNDEQFEMLFTSYATIWAELTPDRMLFSILESDVHSPAAIRVNSILATLDAFYEAYDVSEDDGMYVAPDNRISRWN